MSCAVNNATSGGGKVLSVARLEMVKYVTKGSKSSYLEDRGAASGTGNISLIEGRLDSIKYQQILEANITPSVKKLKM